MTSVSKPLVIELVLSIETVDSELAVLPKERSGPTSILIVPIEKIMTKDGVSTTEIDFRIAFEPENDKRRNQPFRIHPHPMEEVVPGGWTHGQEFPKPDPIYEVGKH